MPASFSNFLPLFKRYQITGACRCPLLHSGADTLERSDEEFLSRLQLTEEFLEASHLTASHLALAPGPLTLGPGAVRASPALSSGAVDCAMQAS